MKDNASEQLATLNKLLRRGQQVVRTRKSCVRNLSPKAMVAPKVTFVVVFLIYQIFVVDVGQTKDLHLKSLDRKMDRAYRLLILHSLMESAEKSRRYKRQISRRARFNLPFFPLYEMDLPVCKDSERESKAGLCEAWAKNDFCTRAKHLMNTYCPKTCNFCKQFNPPGCQASKYGCCWNNSPARGPNRDGCIRCEDYYKRRLCTLFDDFCFLRGQSGKFVRYHCFHTCGWCKRFTPQNQTSSN